ncbi:hypothetical protein PYH68_09045 [Staphylococcus xylosus]|uniref:hypothetical protein n=1 Tax=Staphylococcus xylosus TaxID=1288 RepID=UPI0033651F48
MGIFSMSQEDKYLMSLKNKKEQAEFLKKPKEERKKIVENFKNISEKNEQTDSFKKIGISHPSSELEQAFTNLSLSSKLGGVFAGLAGATMSLKEQEFMKEHVSHTKQNFALMSQNEKIIKQNDEIIELLKQIADK